MTDDRGFTPENVFKALLTLKEATEMGFARVEREIVSRAEFRSELVSGLSGLEQRLGAKIDNLERRVVRIDEGLSAIEGPEPRREAGGPRGPDLPSRGPSLAHPVGRFQLY
jgi:hypothetical protein